MNGDISRIPIQSLGAVISLTDILPELPLPAPLQTDTGSSSLFCDSQLAESANSLLKEHNDHIFSPLCDALENTCTEQIDFKDGLASDSVDLKVLPNLLRSVLERNHALFQCKRGFYGLSSFEPKPLSTPTSADVHCQLKISTEARHTTPELRVSLTALDEQNGSPGKQKKKKRKKKKHKHRDTDGGDTSETGGESNATTPATYEETTPSRKFDDSGLSPTPSYGVVADTNKLSLKIFRRPVMESGAHSTPTTESTPSELVKKEKKKKRNRERDREHKSKREQRSSASHSQPGTPIVQLESFNGPIVQPAGAGDDPLASLPISSAQSLVPSVPPSTNGDAQLLCAVTTTLATLPTNMEAAFQTAQTTADMSFISNDSLFDQFGPGTMQYRQPQSQSTSSLPSTPASAAGLSRLITTSATVPISTTASDSSCPTDLSTHMSAPHATSLFDGILNEVDPSLAFHEPSGMVNSDLTGLTNGTGANATIPSSMCNIMDFASRYLQNEVLSSNSFCDSFPPLAIPDPCDDPAVSRSISDLPSSPRHPFSSSFMIAAQLTDSLSSPTATSAVNVSEFQLPSGQSYVPAIDGSPSTAFMNSFDFAGLTSDPTGAHHVPMGLASYLAAPSQPTLPLLPPVEAQTPRRANARLDHPKASHQKPWKRNAGPNRRRRRRKNEVEDLQQWTVKYPKGGVGPGKVDPNADRTAEGRTWDEAIGSYSQVLGERAKRRKRLARHAGNFDPDFVFEHDKDYHNGGEGDAGTTAENELGTVDLTNDSDNAGEGEAVRAMRHPAVVRGSYAGMDDEEEATAADSTVGADGVARRRRKADDDEPFEIRLKEPIETRFPHIRKSTEAVKKRRERVGFGGSSGSHKRPITAAGVAFGAETGSFKRFLQRLQSVLEAVEDCDVLQSVGMGEAADDGPSQGNNKMERNRTDVNDGAVPPEAMIGPEDLAELCRDAAKLNATRSANQIPTDQLAKFITLLLLNIRDGSSVIATQRADEESSEQESRLWRELAMERVMRSVNAGLTSLLLMTSAEMPREVYVEDVIERTVQTVRFQLFNCIYPEFDPAYRVENSAKENQSSIKSRRARERDVNKPRTIIHLYHKLVEIVSNLAKLVKMQRLTDSLVLALSSVGVSVFFVENVSELQLAALELITAIFSQYEPHRKLIMEEILASLARLPSSKRNLRSYRLNTEDNIQMLTALSLLLVQSVISLPSESDKKPTITDPPRSVTSGEPGGLPNTTATDELKTDDEFVVITSYHNALRTAHTFLLVFLRKSTMKGEDDYRMIFENFVNDLLLAVNKPEWPAAEVMLSLLGSLLVQQFNNKSLDQSVRVASVDYLGTVASTLRRDAVTSQLKEHDIDTVIRDLLKEDQSNDEDDDDDEEDEEEEEEQEENDNNDKKKQEEEEEEDKVKVEECNGEIDPDGTKEEHPDDTPLAKKNNVKLSGENGFPSPTGTDVKKSVGKKKTPKKKVTKQDRNIDPIQQLDRVQALRDSILDYLAAEDASPTAVYARKFYLAQWLNDCTKETERAQQAAVARKNDGLVNGDDDAKPPAAAVVSKSSRKLSASDQELVFTIAERRRQHILFKLREPPDTWRQRRRFWNTMMLPSSLTSRRGGKQQQLSEARGEPLVFHGTLDYEDACLVCRYLASLRPFSQSFDVYLSQIRKLLSESSVPVRTKALRCLSAVVEADPNVLAREDIEQAVHSRLLDTSTSVREAAVDLLGRFLGRKPELTTQYYPMLAERIRDKGVSVRKRVIRILRDICIEQPDFPYIAEICVKMIRRVNDEEGIKKLVNEVFQALWFSPVRDKETVKLLHKVMNITDVVAACRDTGYDWFEQFLRSLLKKEEADKVKPVERACKQIVDCLVQYIMRLEEISAQNNQRLVACLATLHLLTKIRPEVMVQYATLLQTYLRCNESSDPFVLHYVARILEVTVPLMEHPSETFIAQLEEDMVRLTLRHGKMVLESCVACLGSVVNRVSKNYSLARDCFNRLFKALQRFRLDITDDPAKNISPTIRPSILRALFTVGLLCKHFDPNVFQTTNSQPTSTQTTNVREQVFDLLMFFTEQVKSDIEMRKKALSGLGFLCTRHHELLCGPKLREFYQQLLQAEPITIPNLDRVMEKPKSGTDHQLELKCIVLENLLNFFLEEENRMLDSDAKWKARQHQESLKEMGDLASGMGSCVAQTYLKDTLETFFSPHVNVRLTALSVVTTILRQGLIHPVQTVPYLVAMQTDLELNIRSKADAQLQEIDHKFPGFLNMKAIQGVGFSYRLQFVLYPEILRMVAQKVKMGGLQQQQQISSPDGSAIGNKSDQNIPTRRSNRHKVTNAPGNVEPECLDETSRSSLPPSAPLTATTLPSATNLAEGSFESIRGTRDPLCDIPSALNSNLYSMVRGNRSQRRSLLSGMISLFDDSQSNTRLVHLSQLIYVADNLAHFPYQCQEEPLFVVHHVDLMVSMSGSGVLQNVRETLFPELKAALEAALIAHAQMEQHNREQAELQLRTELHTLQAASAEAMVRGDQAMIEQLTEQIHLVAQKHNTLMTTQPPNFIGGSSMNDLRSAALVGRDAIPQMDLSPLEQEEDPDALLSRLSSTRDTALPMMRAAIRSSRGCVLLLTLKQFLKEVYSITDAKIQRYSPTDSPKLWERPLTRRAGIRFHPGPCLQAAGLGLRKLVQAMSLKSHTDDDQKDTTTATTEFRDLSVTNAAASISWPPVFEMVEDAQDEEEIQTEMRSLIVDYLDFRKLILTIDPPGDDELGGMDDLNTSNVSASAMPPQAQATGDPASAVTQVPLAMTRLRGHRTTIVPQTHCNSSEEEDSDDSNAGGASRLMLAQSAPSKRRRPGASLRPNANRNAPVNRSVKRKRKRRRRFGVQGSSSGDESESMEESEESDY